MSFPEKLPLNPLPLRKLPLEIRFAKNARGLRLPQIFRARLQGPIGLSPTIGQATFLRAIQQEPRDPNELSKSALKGPLSALQMQHPTDTPLHT